MKLHLVPARTGLDWVRLGLRAFRRQPMALASLFFLTIFSMSVVSIVPYIGSVLALALLPAASLAMMVAAADVSHGRAPTPAVLLAAFRTERQRLSAMGVLGALYAFGFMCLLGLSAAVDGGDFAAVYLGLQAPTRELVTTGAFQGAMWLCMLMYLPLSMMFWHAPGLVHWHGIPPIKSLFFSFVACARNFGAFALFGLAWAGVSLAAGLVVSVLLGILTVVGLSQAVAGGIMTGTAMMLAAVFFTSVVFTFRDCFEPPERRLRDASAPDAADALPPPDSP